MQLKKITTLKEADSELERVKKRCISLFVKLKSLKRLLHVSSIVTAASNSFALRGDGVKAGNLLSPGGSGSLNINPLALFSQFNVLLEIQQQRDVLVNIIDNLEHVIKTSQQQQSMLKTAKTMLKNIDAELKASRATISKIAESALPKEFRKVVSVVENYVSGFLAPKADSYTIEYQAGPVGDELHFLASIILRDLNDDNGYEHPYYIVGITDVFKPAKPINFNSKTAKSKLENLAGEHKYHLNIFNKPVLPGRYRIDRKGTGFSNPPDSINILTELLRIDHITTQMTRKPVPKFGVNDLDDIKTEYVVDTKVNKNDVTVILKSTTPDNAIDTIKNAYLIKLKQIFQKIHPRFNDLIIIRKGKITANNKASVTPKTANRKPNIALIFEIHTPSDYLGKTLDGYSLQRIKDLFDLTDEELRRVKEAIMP